MGSADTEPQGRTVPVSELSSVGCQDGQASAETGEVWGMQEALEKQLWRPGPADQGTALAPASGSVSCLCSDTSYI